jgi:putative peptide zinc metalloprotease protein
VGYALKDLVEVLPFTRQPEGDEVIIGRPETGIFLALPAEAIEILDDLAAGKSVGDAQESFIRIHHETPDIADLLGYLEGKGFVRKRDGESLVPNFAPATSSSAPPNLRYHFANIPESVARRAFGPTAMRLYLLLIGVAFALVAQVPSLIPSGRSLYFTESRTAKVLIILFVSIFSIFVHEFCHLLAARAAGVKSRIGIGNRLWILVAETDLTGLWAVPRNKRYLPLLAGPVSDGVFASLIIIPLYARAAGHLSLPPGVVEIARASLLICLARLLWQCFFFVRTDFYYVITTFFGCKSLMRDTQVFLQNQVARLFPSVPQTDQSRIPSAELRVIKAYSILWLLGRGLAFLSLFFITFPALSGYLRDMMKVLERGSTSNPYDVVDILVVSMVNLIPLTLGLSLWLASLMKRSRT